jgi:hypothetical protein
MFTQTLPTAPSPASAAARHRDHVLHIQRVWRRTFRHNQTHQLVADFFAHGPTIERVKGLRFVLVCLRFGLGHLIWFGLDVFKRGGV